MLDGEFEVPSKQICLSHPHRTATYGSSRNRASLVRCVELFGALLTAILHVWIDHGADEDWGPMYFPPLG